MAKTPTKKPKPATTIEGRIQKDFGDNVLVGAETIIDTPRTLIPFSPNLDMCLGGGILEGSWVTLTGQPKCGKTISALDFAATAQQLQYGGELCTEGREVYYYNIEGRLRKRDIEGIKGLDFDKFHIIQSTPGKILHAAEYLQIADMLINAKMGSVHILDSYSALCTEAELTSGMDQFQRADGPKLLAKFCRKLANIVPVNRNIVIGITHLMGNPSGYGPPLKEKSGQSIAYHVDVKLRCRAFRPWTLTQNGVHIGQEVDWECFASPLGPPGQRITSYIRYNTGIDKCQELLIMAVDMGVISKGGSWYTLPEDLSNEKYQGMENLHKVMLKNPDWYNGLKDKMAQMFN